MQINNITVPDEGITTQYIADTVGGHIYIVTTSTTVAMERVDDFKNHIDDIKQQIVSLQATVAELEPQYAEALTTVPEVAPVKLNAASSTPIL